jgi:hypothetical protein
MSTITIKDSGAIRILQTFRVEIEAGILPEDADTIHEGSGVTLSELGAVHEFGVGHIPARMWLRGWAASKSEATIKSIRKELETMVRTQTFIRAPLDAIAKTAERSIKGRIIGGLIEPGNAPRTLVGKKPEQRPLIGETKQFRNAIKARMRATFGSGQGLA